MQLIELGRSGLKVAPFAFGGNVFGWTADEPRSFELLDAFVAGGFNLIDTADAYSRWVEGHSGGESETIIGRWLKKRGRRDDVIIASKFGIEMEPGTGGLSRAYMVKAVDKSLQRLQTDYIDLYQSHRDDPNTPMEETLAAYQTLMDAGKIRAIGASNFTAERLEQALRISAREGLPRYETLQPWYNLYDRGLFEGAPAKLCQAESISVIPYFSLASGFLTGKYRSTDDLAGSARAYRVKEMLNERGLRILATLDEVAAEHNATPAQVSLAWLRHRGIAAPIASATSLTQLDELMQAAQLKLDDDQMARLNTASDGFTDQPAGPSAPPSRD